MRKAERFSKGDLVTLTKPSKQIKNLTFGKVYEVIEAGQPFYPNNPGRFYVVNDRGVRTGFCAWYFKKVIPATI